MFVGNFTYQPEDEIKALNKSILFLALRKNPQASKIFENENLLNLRRKKFIEKLCVAHTYLVTTRKKETRATF